MTSNDLNKTPIDLKRTHKWYCCGLYEWNPQKQKQKPLKGEASQAGNIEYDDEILIKNFIQGVN